MARPDAAEEPREASGLTTRLVLDFVEQDGGRDAVEALLGRAGMLHREKELRDENRWFADETRIRLFEAAAEVLGDPRVGRRIGRASVHLNVGQALKLSLRALGSPRLVYANVGKANAKFNRVHRMDVLEAGSNHARIRNVPLGEAVWHPCDCEYNIGLLSCVPLIFGGAPARVRHPRCIGAGDEECVYEVEWSARERTSALVALTSATLAALVVTAVAAPALLPLVAAAAAIVATFAAMRARHERRRRWRLLESQVNEQSEATDLLMASMQDMVSELQLDEVLSKITANAQAAVGGAEFALLVEDPKELRCRSSSELPRRTIETLETWAGSSADMLSAPTLIADLSTVPALDALPLDRTVPLGSLCWAPLIYRDRSLGVLVALASSPDGFLPRDVELLESYAAQAAIALTNAKLYETQQELATQDPLTGLFNHRHFHETVERELERCRRHGGELGLALFDLDGFKRVNDTGGHAEGDEVLRKVAAALESASRRSDLAFRVGGDEFALVLPSSDLAAAESAALRAGEVIAKIDDRTSVSHGIASWPDAGPTKDALLAEADSSLYEMKRREQRVPGLDAVPGGDGDFRKRERLACASRVAVKLAPLLAESEIAETALAELEHSFRFHRAAVHRIGPNGSVRPLSGSGTAASDPGRSEEQTVGRAARGGEPVLVNDTGEEGGSELAAPIRVDGEPWGVLELAHRERGGFDFDDLLFADTIAAAVGAAIHRAQLYAELEGTFMRTLAVLSDALEAKDSYTAAHARDVADLSVLVGRALGMGAEELRTLSYAALLHDIGKIAIRGEVLSKPGPLSAAEYDEIKEHTVVGAGMLERIPYFAGVHPLVRSSHERWDGDGYPDRLAGEAIPLGARIIGACDAYHAMTSDRSYRKALAVDEAIAELRAHAGSQFDRKVVEALLDVLAGSPDGGAAASPTAAERPAIH